MRKLILLAAALFAWSWSNLVLAAEAADAIPDVATIADLRKVPLQRLADGMEVRLGLSDGGEAAGPWRVLYCLIEKGRDEGAASGPTTEPVHAVERIGPLRYRVAWGDEARQLQQHFGGMVQKQSYPSLCAATVKLDRKGVARLQVLTAGHQLVAQRELKVTEVRPAVWTEFARARWRDETPAQGYVVLDEALPAMPRLGQAEVEVSTTQPAAESRLPADFHDGEESPLRLSLEKEAFVVRGKKRIFDDAPEQMLARWWVNGKPLVPAGPFDSRRLRQQMRARQVRLINEVLIDFGLPDYLGELKAGDRIAVQLIWSPLGHEPVMTRQLVQMMQRMQTRDWLWPVMIEFELTEELLATR